jgi:hypothetical protein
MTTETQELTVIEHPNNTAMYLQDKAIIDTQIATAKAFPRSLKRCIENAIITATMDVDTASTCTYSVPRAGKAITGPSVHLAKIIIQSWGNFRGEARVIDTDAKNVICQAIAFDLENNVAIKVEVKRSILTKHGRMTEDMIVVTGNAGNSIALRNAIFAVIPKAVTDKVYKAALQTITGDLSDATKLIAKRKKVIDALIEAYKVTEAEVLNAVGKASIDHIGQDEIVVLIGIGTSIKDGDVTVDQAFRGGKSTGLKTDAAKQETEKLVDAINKATTKKQLTDLGTIPDDLLDLYNEKLNNVK